MINIQNLHFNYRKKKVFEGLNLSFQPGYIYGLLGKNGTGKSTLLRNISGLLFPDHGDITVLNFTPAAREPAFLRDIFLVAEEFYVPQVSVSKFLRANAPFYPAFNHQQFDHYLKEFQIPVENKLHQLSYGQKKKFLIAFALACNTKILLMDEPTNGLDIISKDQFRKVIAAAINENKCILISTHQVKDLEELIGRITIIDEGKVLFDQSMDTIATRLSFSISGTGSPEKILYEEDSSLGNKIVAVNDGGGNGKVNLELLYKAILANRDEVNALFNLNQEIS